MQPRTVTTQPARRERSSDADMLSAFNTELEKIISFPHRFISRDRPVREILLQFVTAIRDELNYVSAELYCLYKYTGELERAAASEDDQPPRSLDRLRKALTSGKVITEWEPDGTWATFVPVFHPGRPATREGGVEAEARTWGVLVACSFREPAAHSVNVLRLLGMEIAHVSEMYELLQYERNIVDCLGQTHQLSMNALATGNVSQLLAMVRECDIVRRLFDGMAVWLYREGVGFSLEGGFAGENVRDFPISLYVTNIPCHDPLELYDIGIGGYHSVILCPLINVNNFFGIIGFFKSYPRTLRSEERAAALVLSQQVSYNMESILLHKNLEIQNLALKYERDFSEKIFASINSGIVVIDETGRILTANAYAMTDLEIAQEEVGVASIEDVIPGLLFAASANQREGYFDVRSGKTICLGFNVSQLKDGLSGRIILFRDITEIMSLRKELRRKEYFSTIGRMASWIAHEVRNPLFAISSIAGILQKQAKGTEQGKFVDSIIKETKTLNLLVDDLLMYGKALELKRERVAVDRFITDIADGMKSLAAELGGNIRLRPPRDGLHAEIDRERMKQVFYNLIKNALEAGADTVVIDVSEEDGIVVLSVSDNGKGIKPKNLAEMFTPFFTTKKSGTGLGLSICRKIVDEHGGSIQILSEQGKGATVRIELQAA